MKPNSESTDLEQWRQVVTHPGYYEVSNLGNVRSVDRVVKVTPGDKRPYEIKLKPRLLKPRKSRGYPQVSLWRDHKVREAKVGTLVIEAFLYPRPDGYYTCHEDGDPTNNRLDNLYYGTPTQNSSDKHRHGTHVQGEAIPWSKLTEGDVMEIRALRGLKTQKEIGSMFNITAGHVSTLQQGKQWKHLPCAPADGTRA